MKLLPESLNKTLTLRLSQGRALLDAQLKRLSKREKLIVTLAAVFLCGAAVYGTFDYITAGFEAQNDRLIAAEQELDRTSIAMARYAKLQARKKEIEDAYKQVEASDGVLGYLEGILRTEAGVASNPQISQREEREFGEDYELIPISLRFPIVDFGRLVKFLDVLVYGQRPLILSSIDIKKRPAGDSLDVELEVSSLRRTK